MLRPPEAVRASMERARELDRRIRSIPYPAGKDLRREWCAARLETRELVRALRAARRTEGALLARWSIA